MAFKIEYLSQKGLDITVLKNTSNDTQIQILPSFGALWHGWIIRKDGQEVNLIDHYADLNDLELNLKDSYKSGNLSPFACRILEGKYIYDNKTYELEGKDKDGNAIHGLLTGKAFEEKEVNQSPDSVSVTYEYRYLHEDAGYPFDYECRVTYSLHDDNSLTLEKVIKNLSAATIPLVDGWHPYFSTGSKVNDCLLHFPVKEIIEFDDRLIPTGTRAPYDAFNEPELLGDTVLDNAFLWDEKNNAPECVFKDPEQNITLRVCPLAHYPVLQLYTPPHRKSIAIETLSGAPDAFNNGLQLIRLSPGAEKRFSVQYKVDL